MTTTTRTTTTIPSSDTHTIVARCTPSGSGAIALIRLSGDDAVAIASRMAQLGSRKKLADAPTHTIHAGWVVDSHGTRIDQVLFLLMRGPKTFTGQDTVEITCHNNPFICEQIIACAIEQGARLAQEGEFTRRSYLNRKIDLIQAEAIHEIIHANTSYALKRSLSQLEGSFSHWIAKLEQALIKLLAFSEASFEFLDDELSFGPEMQGMLAAILEDIAQIKRTFSAQQQIRQGIRIAIVGSVNAGKSSLFNALLNRTRAIVTPIAGTTRDVIESGLYVEGNYWTLLDTAGLRATADTIEQEGIRRAHEEAQAADVVLLVYDGSRTLTPAEQESYNALQQRYADKIITVINKSDQTLTHQYQAPALTVSAATRHNIAQLQQAIAGKIEALLARAQAPYLLNQRHYNLLLGLEQRLNTIQAMLQGDIQYELVSYELREAIASLSELTGKSVSEQALDQVFSSFCVGK